MNHEYQIYLSSSTDASLNLALEEFLFSNKEEDIILIYKNTCSVVVGKHQNAFKEVDLSFIKKHKIPVFRRITGGGTVFHDSGNFNFSMISNSHNSDLIVDFPKHLKPLLDYMSFRNLPATIGSRNEIVLSGYKISGTACHVRKKRSIHHGSFLFSTDLNVLRQVIGKVKDRFQGKAVQSVSSPVINVSTFLPNETIDEFISKWIHFLRENLGVSDIVLTQEDFIKVKQLEDEKYLQWEWNWGYSPTFIYHDPSGNSISVNQGLCPNGGRFVL